jgi:acyl-coenzyme A synthetase/AMP-(fatty) acid ligase
MGFEKYPRFVELVDEVPKTMVGKVSHLELRQLEEEKKKEGSSVLPEHARSTDVL